MTSIALQGICDANKLFLDVFTGPPSKIHDARVLKLSFINSELEQLCSEEFHILGDSAYPVRKWLLTPFRDYGQLTDSKKNYNYKLSATRVKIENAFGLLKQRFRQLTRMDFFSVIKMSKFAIACCVLHNLCIKNDDLWEEANVENFNDNEGAQAYGDNDTEAKRQGEEKRLSLCTRLITN